MAVEFSLLRISSEQFDRMRLQAANAVPEEACGLLGGQFAGGEADVEAVLPITNELHSPIRFRMHPEEQLAAFEWLDANKMALIAIYHSHPNGPPAPSQTDLDEAFYPQAAYLILSRAVNEWECRAFDLEAGRMLPIHIDAHPSGAE